MEIDDAASFHQTEWRAQRLGRIGIGLFVLAAAAGAFGGGIISHARVQSDTVRVEYERIVRWKTAAPLTILLSASGPIEVEFDADYADLMKLRAVQPLPESVLHRGTRRVFRFGPTAGAATLMFEVAPERPGVAQTSIDVGGLRARLSHIIFF